MARSILSSLALLGAASLVLAGCASNAEDADDSLQIVASLNVYGDIAAAIGGDRVAVTSIIDSLSQDPHSFEASARDQLAVSRADLLIENGGGYDAFLDGLVEATGTEAPIVTAVEFSEAWPESAGHAEDDDAEDDHEHAHVEGFNEHVWYDPHTIAHVAEEIAADLTQIDPDGADLFAAHLADFTAGIERLESALADIAVAHEGEQVFVTEPVPVYLIEAAGLGNATPDAFSEAVEEGQDVPPATLLEALRILESGDARAVVANAQTGGAETTQVIGAAEDAGIPVLEFTELVPDGETYLTWMQANIEALADTLNR